MIMELLSCPPKFLSMVIQLHKDQRSQVRLNSDLSGSFPITNCVKQGCVLAPILFSIFFSIMLKQVIENLDNNSAVYICYCLDSNLFNFKRLHAHTWAAVLWPPVRWRCWPCCPCQKSPAAPNFELCRGCPPIQNRGQLEEELGPSSACIPRRVPCSPHHHQWNWAEIISSVHLSGVYHHIRCQDQPGSRQQTGQGKQLLADSTKEYGTTSIWRRALRSSRHTHHPAVWLSHGSPTATIYNSLSISISAVSTPSSTLTGVTTSPMLRSLIRQK